MPVRQFQWALFVLVILLAGLWLWLHTMEHPVAAPDTFHAAPAPAAESLVRPPVRPESETAPAVARPETGLADGHDWIIPNEYLVSLPAGLTLEEFRVRAERMGLVMTGAIDELGVVRLSGSLEAVRRLIGQDAPFEYNYAVEAPPPPDPLFWETETLSPFQSGLLQFLGLPEGSDLSQWGSGVTVAVLDSGWLGHPGIEAEHIRVIDLMGDTLEGAFSGHGTAVAGLVASRSGLSPGLAQGSEILAIRVLDGEGQGNVFTLAEGILAAVDNGADVINMSLGGYGDSQVLRAAVEYAASRGVVLVAAAGNDGIGRVTFPAAYPDVIAVGAVDAEGNRAPFSNFGQEIDLTAPGVRLTSLWGQEDYILIDGTSAAAPLVSAAAARLLQQDPELDSRQVMEILLSQANDKGYPGTDVQYGAGILNLDRLENRQIPGIYDIALADLYPALEEADGATVPLYVSLQNRGTELLAVSNVQLTVNGTDYFYRISGLSPGAVDSIRLPVSRSQLEGGRQLVVRAVVKLPESRSDSRPGNNVGQISIRLVIPAE